MWANTDPSTATDGSHFEHIVKSDTCRTDSGNVRHGSPGTASWRDIGPWEDAHNYGSTIYLKPIKTPKLNTEN